MYRQSKSTKQPPAPRQRARAFTLVEMIAVMGIIVIMLSMLLPAVKAMTGSSGRQGAINEVMASFELARVGALRSGSKVCVAFADDTFPDPELRYRAYIICRPISGGSGYEFLSKWRQLPTGVSFASTIDRSMVGSSGASITVEPADGFPGIKTTTTLPVVEFGSHGGVRAPSSDYLRLYLYEGFHDAGKDVVTQSADRFYDVIALARFTGRARVEVSSRAQ